MKKVIYLLVLCMVLGMAGCGTNQENKEPVSGNVSVETENKENDDVVQNEQIADTGSYPPCVMVDGVIYKDTGYVASMPGCGTMDGEIVSTVAGTELPSENNQSNFGSGYHYQRSSEGQLIVVIDDERIIFRDIEKDDTSIPIEVINFNAKVKEITDDGELLVTHVSTAEGFCQMNDGEYYVGDLIGCEVYNRGILIGTVKDVQLYDHHDVLVVSGTQKILIPYVDAFVKNEDIVNKRIDVELIEGFYNEN